MRDPAMTTERPPKPGRHFGVEAKAFMGRSRRSQIFRDQPSRRADVPPGDRARSALVMRRDRLADHSAGLSERLPGRKESVIVFCHRAAGNILGELLQVDRDG